MHASNSARLETAFSDIAEKVGLSLQPTTTIDALQLVRRWLCNEANGRWLMIVDNADTDITIEMQKEGKKVSLAALLPQSDHGSILITSRNTDVARNLVNGEKDIIAVDIMSNGEAVQLLENKLGDGPSVAGSIQLTNALDNIPLAIVQAAAYINRLKPRMSVEKYLDQLRTVQKQAQLLYKTAPDVRRDEKASNSVLVTWQISFDYIHQKRQSAAYLLSFMSFFNRQGIPEFMVRHYLDKDNQESDVSMDNYLDEEDVDFEEDVAVLRAFSLVGTTQHEDQFEMHGLVQLATRIWLVSTKAEKKWQQAFIQAMAHEFPDGEYDNWQKCQILFPHVLPMLKQGVLNNEETGEWAQLLNNTGWYAWRQGLFTQAENMVREALEIRKKILDPDDSSTLLTATLLGSILSDLGKYREAELMDRQTLARREKLFGSDNPSTLASMGNLALVLNNQGKFEEAESINRETLTRREKLLGLEHLDTLMSMNYLAWVLDSQGKFEEAESINRETLTRREKMLGLEHPDTLTSMNNLAQVLDNQGKYEEAECINRETLARKQKVYGLEHPETLTSMSNLASVLDNQGMYKDAESTNRQTLALREKVLGPEHPDTLTSMGNLALVLHYQGKCKEAEIITRQTLARSEKVLGPEHPHTLTILSNLALVLSGQGKHEEAELINRKTIAWSEKVLSPEHPDTLTSMGNLAVVLDWQGKYEEAELIHRQTLVQREKVLGPENPATMMSMNNLALVLNAQHKYEEAEFISRQTLAQRERVLGLKHPATLKSMANLTLVLNNQGRFEEAEIIHNEKLARQQKPA
jgi:tetratricopeptide (TPR) repeat protein